ncbi:PREDICTED: protein capicua homolog [Galeopterus variegatus]|uniref:Protein capicua homolog n=1 Tax=Galeopterus variegatus TaxID=482537 RepID=A0ABM0S370_GALVR|nr:PREDICTED: protein capicua homolog [Galeopterus variegatus]
MYSDLTPSPAHSGQGLLLLASVTPMGDLNPALAILPGPPRFKGGWIVTHSKRQGSKMHLSVYILQNPPSQTPKFVSEVSLMAIFPDEEEEGGEGRAQGKNNTRVAQGVQAGDTSPPIEKRTSADGLQHTVPHCASPSSPHTPPPPPLPPPPPRARRTKLALRPGRCSGPSTAGALRLSWGAPSEQQESRRPELPPIPWSPRLAWGPEGRDGCTSGCVCGGAVLSSESGWDSRSSGPGRLLQPRLGSRRIKPREREANAWNLRKLDENPSSTRARNRLCKRYYVMESRKARDVSSEAAGELIKCFKRSSCQKRFSQ